MTALVIIQARMGSRRFPGKVLADVSGVPLLGIMLDRLAVLNEVPIVVATSRLTLDDPIARYCQSRGVTVFRGPEGDVLNRFGLAIATYRPDVVVRLTADCPLMDPAVLRLALAEHGASGADYTSNTLVRTYPDGLDVEVCSTEALAAADREASDPPEREHVTPFIYRRPERFCLRAFRSERLANRERWTVDSPEDLDVVHRLLELADWRSVGWEELLDGLGERLIAHDESLRLRPAGRADRDGLLALRNEQLTVRFSKSGREVAADEHDRWFSAVLTCPRTRVWIGEVDGHTVGEVRIDVTTGEADVDLAVDPMYRGHGYGRQLIAQLLETLRADYQVVTLRASVHTDNVASRRSFEANGFLLAESRRPDFLSLELAR